MSTIGATPIAAVRAPGGDERPSSLFRQEVIDARRSDWIGTVRLVPPRLGWVALALGGAVVVCAAALLVFAHYTRRHPVIGELIADRGVLAVGPDAAGTVTRILVTEGAHVDAGQALFEVSGEVTSAHGGETQLALVERLRSDQRSLEADRALQHRSDDIHRQELQSQLQAAQVQLRQMTSDEALQDERTRSAKVLYDRWAVVANAGVVSQVQLLEQRDRYLDSQARAGELKRQASELSERMHQLQLQLNDDVSSRGLRDSALDRRLSEVARTLVQQEAQRATIATAPVSGVVVNLMRHAGDAVTAHEHVLEVLPVDARLQAELWVPSRAIGFVAIGDRVALRYAAYPFEKFGQYGGVIREVSGSAVSPIDVASRVGQAVTDARFRVVVDLDHQSIAGVGRAGVLKPGMAIDADVGLDRRRLYEFVLEPLHLVRDAEPRSVLHGGQS